MSGKRGVASLLSVPVAFASQFAHIYIGGLIGAKLDRIREAQ